MDSRKKIWRQKAKEGRGQGRRRSNSFFFREKKKWIIKFISVGKRWSCAFSFERFVWSSRRGFFLKGWWENFLGKFELSILPLLGKQSIWWYRPSVLEIILETCFFKLNSSSVRKRVEYTWKMIAEILSSLSIPHFQPCHTRSLVSPKKVFNLFKLISRLTLRHVRGFPQKLKKELIVQRKEQKNLSFCKGRERFLSFAWW